MTQGWLTLMAWGWLAIQAAAAEPAMVRLAGTPAEIGRTFGAMNKWSIVHDLEVGCLQKAAATAQAAGVREDLCRDFQGTKARDLFLHECTSYAVARQYARGGAVFFHKTRDNKESVQAAFLVERSLPGVHKFITVTDASRIHCFMMVNDQGLARETTVTHL